MTTSKVISNKHFLALAICGVLASVSLAHAQNADNDVLRRTQMQLRQSEQERNSLRSELARLQAQLDGQRVEFDRMRQQAVQVKGDNHSNEAELVAKTSRLNQATQQLKDTREELERLRADSARSSQAVQNMKSMLDNAEKNSALMQELVGLCRDRNQEMYKVSQELITMYRDKDFNSFTKREPVLQLQQVKLQNLMQEFEDRLRSQRMHEDTLPPSLEKQMQDGLRKDAANKSNSNGPDSTGRTPPG
jgi:septal ring factor EnvC (AmiA/AmiB activator)